MKRSLKNKTNDEKIYPGAAIDDAISSDVVTENLTKQYTRELNNNPRSDSNAV